MQRSEVRKTGGARDLNLDLSPPVRLDLWAVTLVAGIILGTVAPPLGMALVFASLVVSAGALYWRDLVPEAGG